MRPWLFVCPSVCPSVCLSAESVTRHKVHFIFSVFLYFRAISLLFRVRRTRNPYWRASGTGTYPSEGADSGHHTHCRLRLRLIWMNLFNVLSVDAVGADRDGDLYCYFASSLSIRCSRLHTATILTLNQPRQLSLYLLSSYLPPHLSPP